MPVRMMTDEEKEKFFGSGFIVIGQQRPVPRKARFRTFRGSTEGGGIRPIRQ